MSNTNFPNKKEEDVVFISLDDDKEDSALAESSSVSSKKSKKSSHKYILLNSGDLVRYIMMAMCLMIFVISASLITFYFRRYKESSDIYDEVKDNVFTDNNHTSEYVDEDNKVHNFEIGNEIDFDMLESINSDVVGWISFPVLGIEYPVVQGTDNYYYLEYAYNNVRTYAGSIYMHCDSASDWTDQHTIVHGHNMNDIDDSMFGTLEKYDNESFYKKNEGQNYFYIYLPEGVRVYEVFAVTHSHYTNDAMVFSVSIPNVYSISQWGQRVSELSLYDTGITLNDDDTVISLYTCLDQNHSDVYRLVHGKYITTISY